MEKRALIGYTGTIGKNILEQNGNYDCYNRENIHTLPDKEYDIIVCAAPSGSKYLINSNPDEANKDFSNILTLSHILICSKCKLFILISTIDVYSNRCGSEFLLPVVDKKNPYGMNRLWFEYFISSRFWDYRILRLPGLFGPYLKKNVIFDLSNNHRVEYIQESSIYQWYNLRQISKTIEWAINDATYRITNVVSEPLDVYNIIKEIFPQHLETKKKYTPHISYNVTTIHKPIERYFSSKEMILKELKNEYSI